MEVSEGWWGAQHAVGGNAQQLSSPSSQGNGESRVWSLSGLLCLEALLAATVTIGKLHGPS